MPINTIVFDFDGTLVDSAPGLADSANMVLEEHGHAPITVEDAQSFIGDGMAVFMDRAVAKDGTALNGADRDRYVARFREIYAKLDAERTVLYPGALETLEHFTAAGLKMGLCTNKPYDATVPILSALGIDRHLGAVFGGDTLDGIRKPDPRHVLAVLDALGASPADAVMVGDSPNDVKAGQAAGLQVYAVTYGYSLGPVEALGADVLIDSLTELPGILATF
jgi:phosphoglycolate phosphatase